MLGGMLYWTYIVESAISACSAALLRSDATLLQVMGKLVRNAAVSPSEEKFKRIKLTNSKVKSTIVEANAGVPSLLAMGWVLDPADSELLMLPKGTQMTMKEVTQTHPMLDMCRSDSNGIMSPTYTTDVFCVLCLYKLLGTMCHHINGCHTTQRLSCAVLRHRHLQVRAIEDTKDRLKKQTQYQSRMSKASALPGNADKAAIRSAMEADRLERSSQGPVTKGSTAQALPGSANITTAGDLGLNSGGCC